MKTSLSGRKGRRIRHGMTLIEVLIVATGITTMLALCAVSIRVLMNLNADGISRYAAAAALERLGRQLRSDAHSSATAELTTDAKITRVRFALAPAHVIEYEARDRAVVRSDRQASKVLRHESFALTTGWRAHFELRDLGSRRLVVLVVTRSAGKSQTEPARPLEVVSLLGKDRDLHVATRGGKP